MRSGPATPGGLRPFPRAYLAGDVVGSARALLGALLVRDDASGRRVGLIVEVEAYAGPEDAASHARFGPSGRSSVMFGPAGVAYVYLVYGMHHCLNVVTGPRGAPSAVLVRAVEPLEGADLMRASRAAAAIAGRRSPPRDALALERARIDGLAAARLASGPALVSAAFGLDRSWTGVDLCGASSPLRLELPAEEATAGRTIAASPRIGVAYAGERWGGVEWRFHLAGHRSVSGGRRATDSSRRTE